MNSIQFACHGDRGNQSVALTFDDGPNPYATFRILDILDFFNIKATFFVIGKRCESYPEVLKEIYKRGHLIGNHTFSHSVGDFERCDEVIKSIIGLSAPYVRPPFYDLTFCQSENLYLTRKFIINGDVDSKDYLPISSDDLMKNVLGAVKPGSIIDFHDGGEIDDDLVNRSMKTIDALPRLIPKLLDDFKLVRLDEMALSFEQFPIQEW